MEKQEQEKHRNILQPGVDLPVMKQKILFSQPTENQGKTNLFPILQHSRGDFLRHSQLSLTTPRGRGFLSLIKFTVTFLHVRDIFLSHGAAFPW